MGNPTPKSPQLWERAKKIVKARVNTWPSAYASGQLVQEYKRLGGTFEGTKRGSDLSRWYREEWVDVCDWPKKTPCGRTTGADEPMPYCRPSKRVSKATPVTAGEMSEKEREKMCAKKRKNPSQVMPKVKRKSPTKT